MVTGRLRCYSSLTVCLLVVRCAAWERLSGVDVCGAIGGNLLSAWRTEFHTSCSDSILGAFSWVQLCVGMMRSKNCSALYCKHSCCNGCYRFRS